MAVALKERQDVSSEQPLFSRRVTCLRLPLKQATDPTQRDLEWFFQSHLSAEAVANFEQTFQTPTAFDVPAFDVPEEINYEKEAYDLGYYDDGVKRTLTDQQIDMFRQSELWELRQKQTSATSQGSPSNIVIESAVPETYKLSLSRSLPLSSSVRGPKMKKKGGSRREPKPDLRKRTWDVVEKGLDTLEYD